MAATATAAAKAIFLQGKCTVAVGTVQSAAKR